MRIPISIWSSTALRISKSVRHSILICGYGASAVNNWYRIRSKYGYGGKVIRTVPRNSSFAFLGKPNNCSSSCKKCTALGINVSPKSVNVMLRVFRLNSGSPKSFSNSAIIRVITCGETENCAAVFLKLNTSAATTKYFNASKRFNS